MNKKPVKEQYWDIRPIKKIPALYRIVYGERSNGKTYGVDLDSIEDYLKRGAQTAYVRRMTEDIKQKEMRQKYAAICSNEEISRLSAGKWNGIRYYNGTFTLMATDGEDNVVYDDKPFCFTFAISSMEHYKSISFPGIKRIIFDEFISRKGYIEGEFELFMNLISTIVRQRDDVEIWMLGNTVSKDCPYFKEMGLRHVFQQKPGTIDTYSYSKNGQELLIAVEYTKNLAAKKSDKYFIFDNPKMDMITGGAWELAIYPHLHEKYKPKQVIYTFFILYRDNTLQCEIIEGSRGFFTYVHAKTTPLQDREMDLIYSPEPTAKRNWKVDITRPQYTIEHKILEMIRQERVCFQDNEIGEIFNDYLKWCRSHSVIKK